MKIEGFFMIIFSSQKKKLIIQEISAIIYLIVSINIPLPLTGW